MLNRWHSIKKLNRFWLAALLLAGIFAFLPFKVNAAEYTSVSSGDASFYDDFGISTYALQPSITFDNNVETFLYPNTFSPFKAIGYFTADIFSAGYRRVVLDIAINYTFTSPQNINGSLDGHYDIDYDIFLTIDGNICKPYAHLGNKYYFEFYLDSVVTDRFGVIIDGTVSNNMITGQGYVGSTYYPSQAYVKINFTGNASLIANDAHSTTSTYQLINAIYLYSKNINNNLINYFDRQYNFLTAMQSNLLERLVSMQNDNNNNHNSLYMMMVNWFNDTTSKLTSWFDRQHEDLVKLLEETTQGYDNSAGNSENDKLSGALGGMDEAEGQIVDSASAELKKFNPAETFQFGQATLSALKFVKSFVDSFFIASGSFNLIPTVIYTMMFLSIVVGLWRFLR